MIRTRDYGNRTGFWRMLDVMKRCNMRGSVSLNVAMCDHHPEVIKACADEGWEFYSHGTYNTRYLMGMNEAQERQVIQDSHRHHLQTHRSKIRWLVGPCAHLHAQHHGLGGRHGPDLCVRFVPRRPTRSSEGQKRQLTSMPYSLEMNDTIVYNVNLVSPRRYGDIIKRQFDRLYEEGEYLARSCAFHCTLTSLGNLTAWPPLKKLWPTSQVTTKCGWPQAVKLRTTTTNTITRHLPLRVKQWEKHHERSA
jgi:peptidoglycan/xylan/chitin deacetylase (PgdA/CDA1 family)